MTSPRLIPIRNLTWREGGNRSFRVRSAAWISVAQRTASTALANSARIASPAVLKIRPRCVATRDSNTFLWPRNVFSVCSSSSPIRRLNSATSAERIVESLRTSICELEPVGWSGMRVAPDRTVPRIIASTLRTTKRSQVLRSLTVGILGENRFKQNEDQQSRKEFHPESPVGLLACGSYASPVPRGKTTITPNPRTRQPLSSFVTFSPHESASIRLLRTRSHITTLFSNSYRKSKLAPRVQLHWRSHIQSQRDHQLRNDQKL